MHKVIKHIVENRHKGDKFPLSLKIGKDMFLIKNPVYRIYEGGEIKC